MFGDWLFWPFFWFPFHGLFTLLVIVVIVALVFRRRHYYYYNHPTGWGGGTTVPPPVAPSPAARSQALDILESRYARGEIQRDEYLEKKKDLGG